MTNERKWTPGPWVVETEVRQNDVGDNVNWHWVAPEDWHTRVCRVVEYKNEEGMHEANAHLIAAAPELYEALVGARSTILGLVNSRYSEAEGSDSDWVDYIDAALAKARGEK